MSAKDICLDTVKINYEFSNCLKIFFCRSTKHFHFHDFVTYGYTSWQCFLAIENWFWIKERLWIKKNSNIFEKLLVVFEPTATESHYKSDTSYTLTLLGSIQNNLELRSSSEFQFFLIWGFLKTSIDPIFFQHRPKNHTHVSHTPKSKKHPVKKKSGLTWSYLLLSMFSIALL